jgi:hypothetical protein
MKKMTLNYNPKRTITTADLYDTADPPLIFEVQARPPRAWSILFGKFEKEGALDLETAKELISLAFLTVSDGGEIYPLNTIEAVTDLQAAIEENNPGCGIEFVCNIAWAFGRHYYSFLSDHLGNSPEPLSQLNGSSGEKTPALVS